jgi:proline iminopeptidase
MHVDVNGGRLWFDVNGPGLVPSGRDMRVRPTVVLVHGGPGSFDHSYFKPAFDELATVAQVVYLDLRGHGRSEWGDAATWTFERCADDIRVFCDTVGIADPIVFGHSMGGACVLLYGARHPGHAAGLIVESGFARWGAARVVAGLRRAGGEMLADLAARSFGGEPVTEEEDALVFAAFGPRIPNDEQLARAPHNSDLNTHGMQLVTQLDILDQLNRIQSRTLVHVGELDPVTPVDAAQEIIEALPPGIGRLEILADAGHFAWLDTPDRYWPVIIDFVTSCSRS